MPGTVAGGRKAATTNKTRHGKDFYARIGAKGGKLGHTGGFAANRELAREAGRKGSDGYQEGCLSLKRRKRHARASLTRHRHLQFIQL